MNRLSKQEKEEKTFVVSFGEENFRLPKKCPHRQAPLSMGYLNEKKGSITCPMHGSTFCLSSGEQISGPSCGRLRGIEKIPS